ncbi:unnamed protein product [Ambrosiozyma monospora]|uniref:Unnamed protein product n=1 Tax=Ambrosiozyma monospora TaxID=43982 RepID=A0ACB5SVL1_AMBMO|nr:unnamed protein product [Ambrosiozyma monospora]
MNDITNTALGEDSLSVSKKRKILDAFPSSQSVPQQQQQQPSSLEKRQKPENNNIDLKSMRDRRQQLESVLKEKQAAKETLRKLQSEMWSIRTQIPELELKLEKAMDEHRAIERNYKMKQRDLDFLSSKKEKQIHELQLALELFQQEDDYKLNQEVNRLADKFFNEAQQKEEQRRKAKKQETKDLESQLVDLNEEKKVIEESFEDQLSNLKREGEIKIENIKSDYHLKKQAIRLQIENTKVEIDTTNKMIEEAQWTISTNKDKIEKLSNEFKIAKADSGEFEEKTKTLRFDVSSLIQISADRSKEYDKLKEKSEKMVEDTQTLKEKLLEEETARRKLHNRLQEIKGNIRVFCRIKPELETSSFPHKITPLLETTDGKEHLSISEVPNTDQRQLQFNSNKSNIKKFNFGFDKIFGMESSNSEIFGEISQLVQSALDGYNVCIFTYGQTGSGKTYTMSNPNDGMIPRSVQLIFNRIEQLKKTDWEFKVEGQFLEIYNENINDLMTESYLKNLDKIKHQIKHNEIEQTTTITDLTTISLSNAEEVGSILETANRNRMTASTNSNNRSSRSHSVFIISLKACNTQTGESTTGKLNLIDLAGSERISQSLVTGDRLRETQNINKSLSSLGDVIISLGNKKSQHIPYRNSKLTYLLQYSLGGNSKTLMFVNVSPNVKHFNETLNSLRFATKVNNTHIGQATKN